ncbi:MAG: nitroreductase family protein [Clostridiales bacterium]|nr:nitroreductase family protein [Clostridiales bacterium]
MKKGLIASLLLAVLLTGCSTAYAETTPTEEPASEATEETTEETEATAEETGETEAAVSVSVPVSAVSNEEFARYLTEVKTNQYFEDTPVPAEDIQLILEAGVNAQSGMNQQSWHFTAVTSQEILQQIADDMSAGMPAGAMSSAGGAMQKAGIADAPLAILISCGDGKDYDAGLATQAMNAAALALGYGTKIVSSPSIALNGENQAGYKELLGIPDDMAFVGAILIGEKTDTSTLDADAITGPTTRNAFSEMTTLVE